MCNSEGNKKRNERSEAYFAPGAMLLVTDIREKSDIKVISYCEIRMLMLPRMLFTSCLPVCVDKVASPSNLNFQI